MEEALIKRIMPNSLEAEQSVVGSMIMSKDAIVTASEMLLKEDFYHQQYGIIFETMVELFTEGQPVDLVTLQNRLKEKDVPQEIQSLDFVRTLVTSVPTSANIKYYANIVKENAIKRKLIHVTEDIENECYAGKESLESVLDKTEHDVFELLSTRQTGDYVPIRTVVMNALEKIEKAAQQEGTVTGIPTGFIDLDYRTAGLQPSDLVLVAARPSMGKTAFVLNHVTEDIENECYAGKESLESVLDKTEHDVFELLSTRQTGDYVPIRTVVMNALEKIEKAAQQEGTVTGIPTGFIDLDYRTAGLQPSDLVLVAARPSMGKTAFVLNIAQHVAFHAHLCTAIFSLEMSKEQLVNRLFSLESKVDAQALRTGNLSDADWEKLVEGAGIIGDSELIIDDTPGISISELRSKCRKYKLEHDLKLVIIDYLQLMTGSGRGSESRQQEISDISRSLKALARELSVPVVALSQLSRAVEQRPDHRPMLSDLRESGAIEQDADVVMFIYRDDYYNKDTELKGISEIIIAKQRNGPIGTVNLAWLPEYTKFANLEH